MINDSNKYVRFDWAAKRMLRDKANFGVLEGLISVLLEEKVKITEILESEGNQEDERDKFNRVDIMAKNSKGEIIIVEIQQTREWFYLQRIMYGVAKAITEHIFKGDKYNQVKKVYSISIVYFDLGKGSDYVYHGKNELRGIHTGDILHVSVKEKEAINVVTSDKIFPEYYIIRVNEFNKVATTPLEEWLDYLKNGHIKDDTTAPGLDEAKERLQYMQMSKQEQRAYDSHVDAIMTQNDVLYTYKEEGLMEGRIEGRIEGRKEGRIEGRKEGRIEGRKEGRIEGRKEGEKKKAVEIAQEMKKSGMDIEMIKKYTKLTDEEIEAIPIDN